MSVNGSWLGFLFVNNFFISTSWFVDVGYVMNLPSVGLKIRINRLFYSKCV